MTTRVAIFDERPIFRVGAEHVLSAEVGVHVVAESGSNMDALSLVREHGVNLLLVPVEDALNILKSLREKREDVAVLALADDPNGDLAAQAVRMGARGIVDVKAEPETLVDAIRTVVSGRRFLSQKLEDSLIANPDKPDRAPHELLSEREFQVFIKLARGSSAADIAGELSLSVKSVATYRDRLMEKMSLKSNSELTYYAMKKGLLQ
jgi:two-component system, NarL family, invasion response regulator UvrY